MKCHLLHRIIAPTLLILSSCASSSPYPDRPGSFRQMYQTRGDRHTDAMSIAPGGELSLVRTRLGHDTATYDLLIPPPANTDVRTLKVVITFDQDRLELEPSHDATVALTAGHPDAFQVSLTPAQIRQLGKAGSVSVGLAAQTGEAPFITIDPAPSPAAILKFYQMFVVGVPDPEGLDKW